MSQGGRPLHACLMARPDGMKVLAVGSQKGGVGKSTSSLYLAVRAAEALGGTAERPVVGLIDRDESRNLSRLLQMLPDLLPPGVVLLPGEELPSRQCGLALVVIDTPPGITAIPSLKQADLVLVPAIPEHQGIVNLAAYLHLLDAHRISVSPTMRLVALLPTMVEVRSPLHQQLLEDMRHIAAQHQPPLAVLTAVPRRARIRSYDLRTPEYDAPAKELFTHAQIIEANPIGS